MRLRFGLVAEVCERKVAKPAGRQYLVTLFIYRFNTGLTKKNMSWMSHCFCWPLTFSALFVLASAETSCRRGADAAAGPRCQPDRYDAGHHGPGSVLLQRQTDDGEGTGPARALKGRFTALVETKEEPARRGKRCSNEAETQTLSSRTKLVTPHSHSRTTTLNFWDPFHHGQRFQGWIRSFLYFSVVQTLMGRVFGDSSLMGFG